MTTISPEPLVPGPTKIFLSDQTYLGLRYRYEWYFNRLNRVDNNADHGNHVANIGIGFVWGGSRKSTELAEPTPAFDRLVFSPRHNIARTAPRAVRQ